jgi:hypothetical protein
MRSNEIQPQTLLGPSGRRTRSGQLRLLKNGAEAHEFTRDDRAKGGRARAEKIRKRKELRDRFEVSSSKTSPRPSSNSSIKRWSGSTYCLLLRTIGLRCVLASRFSTASSAGRDSKSRTDTRSRSGPTWTALARAREKLALRLDGQAQAL